MMTQSLFEELNYKLIGFFFHNYSIKSFSCSLNYYNEEKFSNII